MLRQKVLPAILFVLPATAPVTVHPPGVEAASDQCKATPHSAAPAGSRWYYRANRIDHSRCWFLSSLKGSVHSRLRRTASVTRRNFIRPNTGEVPNAQQGRQLDTQMASAQMGPAEDRLASE